MNRTIKFRAKELTTGKWVYGDLLHRITSCRIVKSKEIEVDGVKRMEYFYNDVDPDTVGQFTGFYGRDGNEVYEGDVILPYKSRFPFEVKWEDGEYAIECPITYEYQSLNDEADGLMVIGNIHDNPELLKEIQEYSNTEDNYVF